MQEPWGDSFVYISRAPRAMAGLVSCKSRRQVRSKRCWIFLALAMLAWVGIVQFWLVLGVCLIRVDNDSALKDIRMSSGQFWVLYRLSR